MMLDRAVRKARPTALFAALLSLAAGSVAADLASTYAHDAFPSVQADTAKRPCRQASLAKKSRRARKPAPAVRHRTAPGATSEPATDHAERAGSSTAENEAGQP